MKRILAFDTSGPSLSVALTFDGKPVYVCTQQNGLTHSVSLMPLVDAALRAGGISPAEVDCFAVVMGPGSFTGVRIGVTTAKALAHAAQKPCFGVNALEALAAGVPYFDGIVCPMQDARAGQVYAAAYQGEGCILQDAALKLTDFLAALPQDAACCFVGDGAVAQREGVLTQLGGRAQFAPPEAMMVSALVVARLALAREGSWTSWRELMPYYLRAPQAERERLAREAAQHG